MRLSVLLAGVVLSLGLGQVAGDSSVVHYGEAPAWTLPAPKVTMQAVPDGPAVRIVYSDAQTRIGANGTENFFAYRIKILKPEGLDAANVRASWNPAAGTITVHKLNVIRDNVVTDVLKSSRFQVLQREGGLERAVLDGHLTAAVQTPGVQVGDEIEVAATIRQQDPTLGNHAYGIAQVPVVGQPGTFRVRLIWPASHGMKWKATKDLADVAPRTVGNQTELPYEVADPKSALLTDGAPDRFNQRRQIEFSDYGSWAELSRQVWALYDSAATLAANSPVHEEARKIAAQSSDPAIRAIAALRLVQEQIRYLYVGLNDGNIRPATADETWKRRFGDCKGKVVLLLALLRELGVPAEAALVNVEGGDGIDERLPNPALFNHVVVRATIGGKSYWLDGTRLGNLSLANLPAPSFRWALPLRSKEGALMAVPLEAPTTPHLIQVVKMDATGGINRPAKVKIQQVLRGDEAAAYRVTLSGLPSDGADRALKNYWIQQGWGQPETVTWRFDEQHEALIFSMAGETTVKWDGSDEKGWRTSIPGAGFTPPNELKRPKEQDQAAPWATEFPRFSCWATEIRLPAPPPSWSWTYKSAPVDRNLGGVSYWRTADIRENVVRTIMSKRFYQPELSAADAAELNAAIPGFDNAISQVYQVRSTPVTTGATARPPFDEKTNWLESAALCASPKLADKD